MVLASVAYSVLARKGMHDALSDQIKSDGDIRELVGAVESIDFDSSGAANEYGGGAGSRSETLWILKVRGDKNCIYVLAVLDETFPDYRVISVEPERSMQGQVRSCAQT